jgi:hypothetical protein
VALVAKAVLSPGSIKEEWAKSADPDAATQRTVSKVEHPTASDSDVPAGSAKSSDYDAGPQKPASEADGPNIQVSSQQTQYGEGIALTADDDRPFTI